ncbi:MAG: alpha/beta hydrolase [Clostridia bacterium]
MCYEQIYIPRKERRVTEDLLRICVYSPFERKKKATGILWIHGGGYGLGVPEQDEAFIRRFVLTYNRVVVSLRIIVFTTIAPYCIQAALEDCYTALMWLKENAALYDICPNQLMVGGDSAGGGLTAALTIYARDKREVAIAFQMPLYPMLDDRMITKSSQKQ